MTETNRKPVEEMAPQFYLVRKRKQESEDVFTFELESPGKNKKTPFLPGQFNMLYAFGLGEVAISISGNPKGSKRWVHTIRAVGATTKGLSNLKVGDSVGVRGPYGKPWPIAESTGNDIVFIAGGLGLAPLRPAILHVKENRKKYGRVSVLYGARSDRDLLYRDEIAHWKKAGIETFVALSQADRKWKGIVGHVTTLVERIALFPERTRAFLCGPEIMMRFGASELRKRNLAAENIFISMERNMKCAIGFCGHCQLGPTFLCKDGPVYPYHRMEPLMRVREL